MFKFIDTRRFLNEAEEVLANQLANINDHGYPKMNKKRALKLNKDGNHSQTMTNFPKSVITVNITQHKGLETEISGY